MDRTSVFFPKEIKMHTNNTVVFQGGLNMWNRNLNVRRSGLVSGLQNLEIVFHKRHSKKERDIHSLSVAHSGDLPYAVISRSP